MTADRNAIARDQKQIKKDKADKATAPSTAPAASTH
jgi:hypothetical protein